MKWESIYLEGDPEVLKELWEKHIKHKLGHGINVIDLEKKEANFGENEQKDDGKI